jgi:hypothetical protein
MKNIRARLASRIKRDRDNPLRSVMQAVKAHITLIRRVRTRITTPA